MKLHRWLVLRDWNDLSQKLREALCKEVMNMGLRNSNALNSVNRNLFIRAFEIIGWVGVLSLLASCQKKEASQTLYELLPTAHTQIDFVNELTPTEAFNAYTYRNFYNGGGVGIGDVNNDGLADLYFCGNQVANKLYLNLGNEAGRSFQFEDITEQAGVASQGVWSTGVSMVDVNGDGWLDIYVCKSGDMQGENGTMNFSSTMERLQMVQSHLPNRPKPTALLIKDCLPTPPFFDYDRDGDLDCYLLNNSFRSVGNYDLIPGQREIRDSLGGNKLYRNDQDIFTDVSEEAGIYGSEIGFGLGVTVGDVNRDGWPDIYVSNDFFEKDYLYINQQDGTFAESLEKHVREISLSSMGADMADISNDGYPEIFVTDMLPEGDARIKTTVNFENWDKYQLNQDKGYYRQFTRNVLQLNLGSVPDSTAPQEGIYFSEIGRLAGVYATDWSWGALIMDMDKDGYKDILVANGIYKDLMNQDYINFMANPAEVRKIIQKEDEAVLKLIDMMPSQRIPNYAFKNEHNLTFTNMADAWGLAEPSHSNGSAYGDLDNDGDLDLVINNVNMPPFVYENHADRLTKNHYLSIQLKGKDKNTYAIGAQVTARHQGQQFYQEQIPSRGFESSVGYGAHFGLGEIDKVDTVEIRWPKGEMSMLTNVKADTTLTVDQRNTATSDHRSSAIAKSASIFTKKTSSAPIQYTHHENDFNDFDRDRLIYHMLSNEGPKACQGDVNADGLADVFIAGAKGFPGQLFFQTPQGSFIASGQSAFEQDKESEDADCIFFDADADGDADLYVASGGKRVSDLLHRTYRPTLSERWKGSLQPIQPATSYQ
jgi:hypothetical protein